MHVSVQLKRIDGPDPPYDHNSMLAAAVYEALRANDSKLSERIHSSPKPSPFVLSEIFPFNRADDEFWFRLASPDNHLARTLASSIFAAGKIEIGDVRFEVTGAQGRPTPTEIPTPFEIHTLSPIYIRDRESSDSLVKDNCDYLQVITEVINHQLQTAADLPGTLSVMNADLGEVRKRTIADRTVLAQKGHFWLDGDPREVAWVLDYGIGQSRAMGFGLVVGGNNP